MPPLPPADAQVQPASTPWPPGIDQRSAPDQKPAAEASGQLTLASGQPPQGPASPASLPAEHAAAAQAPLPPAGGHAAPDGEAAAPGAEVVTDLRVGGQLAAMAWDKVIDTPHGSLRMLGMRKVGPAPPPCPHACMHAHGVAACVWTLLLDGGHGTRLGSLWFDRPSRPPAARQLPGGWLRGDAPRTPLPARLQASHMDFDPPHVYSKFYSAVCWTGEGWQPLRSTLPMMQAASILPTQRQQEEFEQSDLFLSSVYAVSAWGG